jgi:hypothetical protein
MSGVADRLVPTEKTERDGTLAAAGIGYTLAAQADETELEEAATATESAPRTGNLAEPLQPAEQKQTKADRSALMSEQTGYRAPMPDLAGASPQRRPHGQADVAHRH